VTKSNGEGDGSNGAKHPMTLTREQTCRYMGTARPMPYSGRFV
jgi:hypothetical protein